MKRYLRLFGHYLVQYCKVRLAYKADFFISIVSTLVATMFGLALVFLLFRRAPEIAGWSFHEILFLYGFGLIPLALFNTISVNLYYFGQLYIIEGKFDRVLLRPVHSLFQVMNEQFRLESLSDAAVGLGLVIYSASKIGLELGLKQWLIGAAAVVCGLAIYMGVFLILTCVSFWAEDRVGIIPPVYNMLTFGRYPLDIYNPLIRFLLSWVIPFGFAAFYPSAKLLGHTEHDRAFLALPLVAAVSVTLAILLWNRGVRNYSSTGS
jgi:ABC-2 type transport system permease protein